MWVGYCICLHGGKTKMADQLCIQAGLASFLIKKFKAFASFCGFTGWSVSYLVEGSMVAQW